MDRKGKENGDEYMIPVMEVEYPPEERIRQQKAAVLAAVPPRGTIWERIRKIYWEPGIHVVFYQSGWAWCVTGAVYVLMLVLCILMGEGMEARAFLALMAAPMLYLVFSIAFMWSEEQEEVVELKRTLCFSFDRLTNLRMFYSGIVMAVFDILLLPAMGKCSLQEVWAVGAAGVSSSILFALLSLYLYRRIGRYGHIKVVVLVWMVLCAGVVRYGNVLYPLLFEDVPAAVHLAAAVCCLAGFMDYLRRTERNAYA